LAFPVDDGFNSYEIWIVSLPDGKLLGQISKASQPHFRHDGLKLLANGEHDSFGGKVFEADASGHPERAVSGDGLDTYPFYKPDGSTLTYSNPHLAYGSQGFQWYVFVQCNLNTPDSESQPVEGKEGNKCAQIADFGVLVPVGFIGDIIGSHPVWLANDQIAYKGCDGWGGNSGCGIFAVSSWATKRSSNGENPHKLVSGETTTPTDSKGGLMAYQARETGDWEAYIVSQTGGQPLNISNSPSSNDGLPTLSPDNQWVAFVSDRSGAWAIYVAPVAGGPAQKLLDFPKANPWGVGDRDWMYERISWGP
jgi:Tol biopolymer transport system component